MVALVVTTSPIESAETASITLESILFPNFLLKSPIHSFTPTESTKIKNGIRLKTISSGFRNFPMLDLKREKPT